MTDHNIAELVILACILAASGGITGILAGLLGIGGGIIIVPVLYYLFSSWGFSPDICMHLALGTSLATIVATASSSFRTHSRAGFVDSGLLKRWAPWILLGVLSGAWLASHLKGLTLSAIFGSLLFLISMKMALGSSPKDPPKEVIPEGAPRFAVATIIGFLSSLMGVGGGAMAVPALSLCGFSIRHAVGTSSAFGFIIGLPGAISYAVMGWHVADLPPLCLGYVNILSLVLILPFSMLCAPVGAKLAHRINTTLLRRFFAFFLAFMGLRMLYQAFF